MFNRENTEGYSDEECDKLNLEFEEFWWNLKLHHGSVGIGSEDQKYMAEKEFSDKVSRR